MSTDNTDQKYLDFMDKVQYPKNKEEIQAGIRQELVAVMAEKNRFVQSFKLFEKKTFGTLPDFHLKTMIVVDHPFTKRTITSLDGKNVLIIKQREAESAQWDNSPIELPSVEVVIKNYPVFKNGKTVNMMGKMPTYLPGKEPPHSFAVQVSQLIVNFIIHQKANVSPMLLNLVGHIQELVNTMPYPSGRDVRRHKIVEQKEGDLHKSVAEIEIYFQKKLTLHITMY